MPLGCVATRGEDLLGREGCLGPGWGRFVENELERALRRAAAEPAERPAFYRVLLASQVFVLGSTQPAGERGAVLAAGSRLAIDHWQKADGSPVLPFFSSLEALRRAIDVEASYVALPARALFEMTLGETLVLDPRSSHGKEFLAHEIEALLATGTNAVASSRVVEKETSVLLGQPANHPTAMVSALATLLAQHPSVKAAYLCLMSTGGSVEPPTLVVGLEGEGDLAVALHEAGCVAADTAPDRAPVDLTVVRRDEGGLSEYFLQSVTPFYRRA